MNFGIVKIDFLIGILFLSVSCIVKLWAVKFGAFLLGFSVHFAKEKLNLAQN